MKQRSSVGIYSCIWGVAIIILIFSIFQNMGDLKMVNLCGIVRGLSQKIVKTELYGNPNNEEIAYLDGILEELQNKRNSSFIFQGQDASFKEELTKVNESWSDIKQEIYNVRNGADNNTLYTMSESYFREANHMVSTAEAYTNKKLFYLVIAFVVYLISTIGLFNFWNRRKQKEIQEIRYQDELTGILNYPAFKLNLQKMLNNTGNNVYALIEFDIDNFKFLNTTYGYTFGTDVLRIIANTISSFAKKGELYARIGADHFIMFVQYQEDVIEQLKDLLYKRLEENTTLHIEHDISFTFGACLFHKKEIKNYRDVLDYANLSHKNAKQMGRGSIVWYNDNFMKKIMNENKILKRMHQALEKEEFQMYLQPKFNISTGEIIAAEALTRWRTSTDELLFPDAFIPLFEKNGFIYELDFYILNKACEFIKENTLEKINFTISVNFSRVTLYHKEFYKNVIKVIKQHQVPSSCIEIEITESAFNGLDETILTILKQLQQVGFKLSIDDFGTGYSTFNLLNTLPIDILKIDRDFVKKIGSSKHALSIIELIISVSHTLDIVVVCEGIETKQQLSFLKKVKCDIGQGYYISKPLETEKFKEKFLFQASVIV